MENMLKKFGQKALEKFLCETEIALTGSVKTAAGFWAAKEATAKALGTGIGKGCSFKDIKIEKSPKNAPSVSLARHIIEEHNLIEAEVSITHDGEYAIAVVVLRSSNPKPLKGF